MHRILSVSLSFLFIFLPVSSFAIRQVDYVGRLDIKKVEKIVVDSARARLYVFNGSDTISTLSLDGEPLFSFGGKDKSKKWTLKEPSDLVVASDRIYVTDEALHRVSIFTLDGEPISHFAGKGDEIGELNSPQAITAFGEVLYVADKGNERIQLFGPDGVPLQIIGAAELDDNGVERPVDLAIDSQRNLMVLDEKSRSIRIFDNTGSYQSEIAGGGRPVSISIDVEGIYVADRDKYKVTKYGYNGTELFSFGVKGKGESQFRSVDSLSVSDEGVVYVADRKRGAVQSFAPELLTEGFIFEPVSPVTSVAGESYLDNTVADKIHFGKSGLVYAVDKKGKAVRVFNNRELKKTIQIPKVYPVAVAEGNDGELFILDRKKSKVVILNSEGKVQGEFGSSGGSEGRFSDPQGLLVNSQGILFVLDTGNDRIQAFNSSGIFLKAFGRKGTKRVLEHPVDFALSPNDHLLVIDDKTQSVLIYDDEGDLVTKISGAEDEELFDKPTSIVAGKGEFFVLDQEQNRILSFDYDGTPLTSFVVKGIAGFERSTTIARLTSTSFLISGINGKRPAVSKYSIRYTPDTPVGVKATPAMRSMRLSWDKLPQDYIDEYIIYRNEKGGEYQRLKAVHRNQFEDQDLQPGVSYGYRVSARAVGGNEGTRSEKVEALPLRAEVDPVSGLEVTPHEWSAELTWTSLDDEYVSGYRIYQDQDGEFVQVGEAAENRFLVSELTSDVDYRFAVSSVSVDRVETEKIEITAKTLVATRPPLEIEVVNVKNIFSNNYKIYESNGLGTVRLINNTRNKISRAVVSFQLKVFMDFPWELEVKDLLPEESREIELKAVFNNRILEVSEDTPVQGELIASYYRDEEKLSYPSKLTLNVYEKHKMLWSEEGMFASFITPKDSVVLEFIRAMVTQFPEFTSELLRAGIVFESLGVYGLTYIPDPNNPYQTMSQQVAQIDYVQYPRETLKRKSGDCDDLVGLYSAALESLGIKTKAVAIPGHMFMMFSTGLEQGEVADDLVAWFVENEGVLWIPVEVTVVGQPFMQAWQKGVENYFQWEGKGLTHFDFSQHWIEYKPANLPAADWVAEVVERQAVEGEYPESLQTLNKIQVRNTGQHFLRAIRENPNDTHALLQLGIIFAQGGELKDASEYLHNAERIDPGDAAVLNGLGNVYYLLEENEKAVSYYNSAAELAQGDPEILINLTRAYLAVGEKEKAKGAFEQAAELDSDIRTNYRSMSFKLF